MPYGNKFLARIEVVMLEKGLFKEGDMLFFRVRWCSADTSADTLHQNCPAKSDNITRVIGIVVSSKKDRWCTVVRSKI